MRDIGNHDDRVIQESALFEFKVFNRDSRDIHACVPHGGDAGDLIDPLEQFATEEAVLAVDVHIAQEVGGFGAGVSYGSVAFFIHGDSPFKRSEIIR